MRRVLFPLLACLGLAGPAPAQSILSEGGSYAALALLPGRPEAGGARIAGLEITLAEGWKTYWRSPGAAGIPPALDWSRSRNLAAAEVLWPRPVLFESFGLRTVGYAGRVVLPLRLTPRDPARPVELVLDAAVGICSAICIVESATLTASIAPGETSGADAVAEAIAAVPPPAAQAGLAAMDCRLTGAGERRRLEASLAFAAPPSGPVVLLEGPDDAWFEGVATRAEGDSIAVAADLVAPGAPWIARGDIRMTVLGADGFAADIRGCRTYPD